MTLKNNESDYTFKLVLIGDSGVGLLLRFADDSFSDSYISTIGVDFRFRTLMIGDKKIKLQIWDTAGQERFRTITNAYYKGAHGIILVYDVTNYKSFQNIDMWLNEVNRNATDNALKLLVGNKLDLKDNKQVTTSEAKNYANSSGLQHLETSSKDNVNVEKVFLNISQQIIDTIQQIENLQNEQTIQLNDDIRPQNNNTCAC